MKFGVWRISKLSPRLEKTGPSLESPNSGPFSPNSGPSLENLRISKRARVWRKWAGAWSISKLSLENLRTEFGESPNAGLSLEKICPRLGNFQTHPEFGENGPEFGESPNSSPFSPNSGPSLPKFDTQFELEESPT